MKELVNDQVSKISLGAAEVEACQEDAATMAPGMRAGSLGPPPPLFVL